MVEISYDDNVKDKEIDMVKSDAGNISSYGTVYLCGEGQKFNDSISSDEFYIIINTNQESEIQTIVDHLISNHPDSGFIKLNKNIVQGKYHKYIYLSDNDIILVNTTNKEEIGFNEYLSVHKNNISLNDFKPKIASA